MQRYEVWLSSLQDREGDVEVSGRPSGSGDRPSDGFFDRPITVGEFAALVGEFDEKAHTKAQSEWLEMARENLDETKRLIQQSEKSYEPHVPDWPEWEPPEYVNVFKKGDQLN